MAHATLEHINYCTPDPLKTAAWMADVFGWKIRWQGDGGEGGRTIHMGGEHHYLALHCPSKKTATMAERLCNGWPDEPYWRFGG